MDSESASSAPGRPRAADGHDDRLGQPVTHVRLPSHPRRPQVVDAQPRHHGRQVRLRIGDRGPRLAGPGQAEERVLHDVLRVAHGTSHPVVMEAGMDQPHRQRHRRDGRKRNAPTLYTGRP